MKTYLVIADLTGPGLVESTAVDECMQVLAQPINGKLFFPYYDMDRFPFLRARWLTAFMSWALQLARLVRSGNFSSLYTPSADSPARPRSSKVCFST